MRISTIILILLALAILWGTHQTFWVIVGGLLFLAYLLNIGVRSAGRGVRKASKKMGAVYAGELKEMDGATGKYPSKFFDGVGKDIVAKVNEHQAPAWAKTARDADAASWTITKPLDKLVDSSKKIMDSLAKLFSK